MSKPAVIKVGSRVTVDGKPHLGRGTVRFLGPVKFSSKDNWAGVELDQPVGKHNGTVQGVSYFACEENHGVFLTKDALVLLSSSTSSTPSTPATGPRSSTPSTPSTPSSRVTSTTTSPNATPTPSPKVSPKGERRRLTIEAIEKDNVPTFVPNKVVVQPVQPSVPQKPSLRSSTAGKDTTKDAGSKDREPKKPEKRPSLGGSSTGLDKKPAVSSPVVKKAPKEEPDNLAPSPVPVRSPSPAPPSTPTATPTPTIEASPTPTRVASPPPSSPASSEETARKVQLAGIAEAEGLLQTLNELSEWKKSAQESLKRLTKENGDLVKAKATLEKDLAQAQKEKEKIGKKMQKAFDREKEKMKKEWEEEKEDIQDELATANDNLEMVTLDKELAEEKAEALEAELEKLKLRFKIKGDIDEDEDTDEDDEGGSKGQGASSEEVEALQSQIKRLTDALMKLKDLSVYEKKESEKVIKQLQRDKEVIPVLEDKIKSLKEENKKANDQINHLKEELDIALEAEDMIEELTEKNLSLEENIAEMQQNLEDLEALQQVSEELEHNQAEVEKQLRTSLYKKEIQYLDALGKIKNHQNEVADREKTIEQFREKVAKLQRQLKDFEEKEEALAEEAKALTSKSKALMDQNLQLQSKVIKARAMALDQELNNLNVAQARKHLHFIESLLPEDVFVKDQDSLQLRLVLDRLIFKARLVSNHLQQTYKLNQVSFNLINDVELENEPEELSFAWELYQILVSMVQNVKTFRQTLKNPEHCNIEAYIRVGRIYRDFLPYEKQIDNLITIVKKEELSPNFELVVLRKFNGFLETVASSQLFAQPSPLDFSEAEGEKPAESKEETTGEKTEKVDKRMEPRVWNQLQSAVDDLVYNQHSLLLVFAVMKQSIIKADSELTSLILPRGHIRDTLETCRKLTKHLQEKPVFPRHYANNLENKLAKCSSQTRDVIGVLKELLARAKSGVASSLSVEASQVEPLKAMLTRLLSEILKEKGLAQQQSEADQTENKDKEKDKEVNNEQQGEATTTQQPQQPQSVQQLLQFVGLQQLGEWKFFEQILAEINSISSDVCEKVINSTSLLQDASEGAKMEIAIPSPSASPIAPKTKPAPQKAPWHIRAEGIRKELEDAASVRNKLHEAEAEVQNKMRNIKQLEQEVKELLSRHTVLQIQSSASQKKENELNEQIQKLLAKHAGQEKMYEEALESLHNDNAKAEATIRQLREEISNLEDAKLEMENQHAELPALEFVSAEIRSLKTAVTILRQQNVEYRAQEGLKKLKELLPPLEESLGHVSQLQHQKAEKEAMIVRVKKQQAELRNTLKDIKMMKASNRVVDLTLEKERREAESALDQGKEKENSQRRRKNKLVEGSLSSSQQWAAKKLEMAKMQKRCEELKENMRRVWMEAEPGAKAHTDFASFPSATLTKKLQTSKPVQVGKLSIPSSHIISLSNNTKEKIQEQDLQAHTEKQGKEMKDFLATLRKDTPTCRVVFNATQLAKVHSLLIE